MKKILSLVLVLTVIFSLGIVAAHAEDPATYAVNMITQVTGVGTTEDGGTLAIAKGDTPLASGDKVAAGTSLTATATAKEGYEFDHFDIYNAKTSEAISGMTGQTAKQFTFTTPASGEGEGATGTDINVYAVFKPIVTDEYKIYIAGEQVTNANLSGTVWSYDVDTKTLTINGNIEADADHNHGGAALYIDSASPVEKISVAADSFISSSKAANAYVYGIYAGKSIFIEINSGVSLKVCAMADDETENFDEYAIYTNGALNISGGGTLTASISAKTLDVLTKSIGISAAGLTVESGTTVNAYSRAATVTSCGINVGALINKGTITASSAAAPTSAGIIAATSITNESGASITATGGESAQGNSWGISAVTAITNKGTITATAGRAGSNSNTSTGIYTGTLTNSGTIKAISDASAESYGISASSLENASGATITANSGDSSGIGNSISAGIYLYQENGTVTNSGTINATAGDASMYSYGIDMSGSISIKNNGKIDATSGTSNVNATGIKAYNSNIVNNGEINATSKAAKSSSCGIFANEISNEDINSKLIANAAGDSSTTSTAVAIHVSANTLTNVGTVKANATGGANNTAIEGSVVNRGLSDDSSAKLTATAGDSSGNGNSIGIEGDVTNDNGTLTATSGSVMRVGNESNAIKGTVIFDGGVLTASSGTGGTGITSTVSYNKIAPQKVTRYTSASGTGSAATTASETFTSNYVKLEEKDYVTVESVTLTADTPVLYTTEDKAATLTAVVKMSDGTTATDKAVTWNAETAGVIKLGTSTTTTNTATPQAAGSTYVTATVDGVISNKVNIAVKSNKDATSITLDKTTDGVKIGSTVTRTATLTPTDAEDTITWTTSDKSIATVTPSSDGRTCTVKGIKTGEAIITAKIKNGSSAKCKMVVSTTGNAYKITPSYGAWYIDKSDPYTFSINIPSDGPEVEEVYINGKLMNNITSTRASSYTAVTVPYKSMKTLNRGYSQQLKVLLTDGTILYGKVAVIYTTDAPPTGDVSLLPFAVSAIVSAAGATSITLGLTKKKKK